MYLNFLFYMGQKVHPLGFRVGITRDHRSDWFAKPSQYSKFLYEDKFIRTILSTKLKSASISEIKIRRKLSLVEIIIYSAKPNSIFLNDNSGLDVLCKDLEQQINNVFKIKREILLDVVEIVNPDLHSKLLAEFIAEQLEKRVPFRRVVKSAMQKAQQAGVKGIKIQISGRLNGAEIARTEWVREGQVPLQTLRANIDYCYHTAQTIYGILGIKVWIFNTI